MSTQILDLPAPAPEDDDLARHILVQEALLKKITTELQHVHLAAAARKIFSASPGTTHVILGLHPGRFSIVDARSAGGHRIPEDLRLAAEHAIAGCDPINFGAVAGRTIDLTSAAAWWAAR